ncbi:UvrD-helicase domain-containing protein [Antrihabitans cavernicola]|uniref:DNA 3'-5' helicase n=1 Tax=Antrihabitans cavernicola TaxID=2495913 RepID=A0A5A7SH45_9NOCA|nr:UvrD-helicase domain-containing protein [Spelaeibacter cavernicola]KAA0024037.1 ATP-dependent helicase [Spelaeibacter cavernicola]
MSAPRVSPADLANALGLPRPTAEQEAVIAASPGPTLVIAGAGAGKTETMASRVVWMVANRLVAPEQVLGLTFTRKAAQQLTSRIRTRLARLAGSPLLRTIDPSGELRASILGGDPEVSTYHSYAGRLLAEHGLLLPMEPTSTLLTETQLWQVAHRVVAGWDGALDIERSPASITESVLALAGQLAEHLVDSNDLREAHTELDKLIRTLPAGPRQRGAGPSQTLLNIVTVQNQRIELLPLVRRLSETLRQRGALDFGSQMSLAARLAADHPSVGKAERQRFRLVLLDEYQDTGHAQRVLLSGLFGGGEDKRLAVTAVGDPMQSIYGWRGASAANLPRFATDFPRAAAKPARTLPLSTSWRNPPEALSLANLVAEPLRHRGVPVESLRARPGAGSGDVRLALLDTVKSERVWIAEQIARDYAEAKDDDRPPPTAAVLVRRNADAAPVAEALRAKGLPVEIVGLGGLLHTPEVADVVAMLRLIADPAAGAAAVRVLTGSRWQLGVADLRALWRRASELSIVPDRTDGAAIHDAVALRDALGSSLPGEHAEKAGLGDAISDPGLPERYSELGYQRITALAKELTFVRERIGQPLTELVAEIERTIGIGVEAQARVDGNGFGVGREHLDAFADVVASYASDPSASVGGLLSFLDAADDVENGLEPGEVEVAPDRVQVLTVHSAKGLEWQVVAVPHVVRGVFPSNNASATWLGSVAELPPSLRGDRAFDDEDADGVPVLNVEDVNNRADLDEAVKRHKAALARRKADEDRRLFYVALTRTERVLYVSGHHWAETGIDPKGPSPFLEDLKAVVDAADPAQPLALVDRWDPAPEDGAANPFKESPVSALWPKDPLGQRRAAVTIGAQAVLDAMAHAVPDNTDDDPENWAADVDALLAEHTAVARTETEVALPGQLTVSQMVELRADPDRLAARLRRPLPFAPNPLARRGTAFHAWVERRFGATRLLDLDELPGAADTGAVADTELTRLQDAFLDSPWAVRNPVEVEVPFETSVGGTVVRGRIDAVFADKDGWTVVDWKTGAEPTPAEVQAVVVQLAVYRLAWARLESSRTGEPEVDILARVRAAFHYVRSGRTIAPDDLPGRVELERLIESAGRTIDNSQEGTN